MQVYKKILSVIFSFLLQQVYYNRLFLQNLDLSNRKLYLLHKNYTKVLKFTKGWKGLDLLFI